MSLRFGIYAELQTPPEKPHAELYREIMRQMEHADQAGFDVYSIIEHHFFQEFSTSANPLAMICAAAQNTQRLRFRVALHTLPLCNPMRLAGEIAAADIICNGRLETGLGRGHAWLFPATGVELAESRGRFNEALEILIRAWTQERFDFSGEFYQCRALSVVPKPLQKPYPPLYTGGTSLASYELAGKHGWGMFLPPLLPFKVMEPSINAYLKAAKEAGQQPNIVYIRPVYLGDDPQQIEQEVKPALLNFLKCNASPVRGLPSKEELNAKGYAFYASGALESLTKLTYEQVVEQEIGFIGTPRQVIEQIQRLREQAPITELAIVSNFGGLEHWKVLKTQERFAREVMPAFR
ncbi:MAG: LLM class flavin-dependent oxidoreductase [Planctomycetia bacterium]|nr:LLM class flavin-dependent oxidoreductase [Planctomycetia bacterium]